MEVIRPMTVADTLKFHNVNLDGFTETFGTDFYLHYLTSWPECCFVAESPDGTISGYMIGKVEGNGLDWHGHCSAVTVAPEFRRGGLASRLMKRLEDISMKVHNCYFMDLYVRPSNTIAVNFYRKLGYVVYRVIPKYYDNEPAYDMRKPLPRDKELKCLEGSHEAYSPPAAQ